ncbi:MAG: hypothetical protein FWC97_03135 [Treponema sp.]|nr:hypothetical protein [Treponema sp.]
MAKKILRVGILVMVLVFGMVVIGCGWDVAVTISGTPIVGQTLFAGSQGTAFDGDFLWEHSRDGINWTRVPGVILNWGQIDQTNRWRFILGPGMQGFYIRVSRDGSRGRIFSETVGPVAPAGSP